MAEVEETPVTSQEALEAEEDMRRLSLSVLDRSEFLHNRIVWFIITGLGLTYPDEVKSEGLREFRNLLATNLAKGSMLFEVVENAPTSSPLASQLCVKLANSFQGVVKFLIGEDSENDDPNDPFQEGKHLLRSVFNSFEPGNELNTDLIADALEIPILHELDEFIEAMQRLRKFFAAKNEFTGKSNFSTFLCDTTGPSEKSIGYHLFALFKQFDYIQKVERNMTN